MGKTRTTAANNNVDDCSRASCVESQMKTTQMLPVANALAFTPSQFVSAVLE